MTQVAPIETEPLSFFERYKRSLFLIALFIVIFVSIRLVIRPINNTDYKVYFNAINAFWSGHSPYTIQGYLFPPWTIFLLAPLGGQPLETWLALTVALFVVIMLDLGKPAGLLLLIHPIFITLIASSNPEWILVGSGLWLLEHLPRGWGRGIAWLLLASKPQSTILLLVFDGVIAFRQRDWKAFGLVGVVAVGTFLIFPTPFAIYLKPHDWSASIVSHYTIIGAALATVFILVVRRRRLADYKTLGLLLTQVWTPYTLQYNFMSVLFTLRNAGWLRTLLYVVAGIGLAYLFWRDFHVAEEVGAAGMLFLAAILAPTNPTPGQTTEDTIQIAPNV